MKNNSIFLALLGVSALLFVGCMKEEAINEQYRPAGSEIVIGASTDYDNGEATRTEYDSVEPATRTDYSGAIYGSSPKRERVDWLAGDNMTIFYKQGTAAASSGVYGVTTINPDNEKSYADVVNTSGTKLTWGDGTGDHYFYAMYPAKGFGGNNGMDLTNTNHVNGTIPATQDIDSNHKITVDGQLKYQPDMKYAYLVSYKKIDASSTATRAELPFRPAVTTFEYKFKLNDNDAATERTVTKFTMTSATTNLTGTFEFDITGGNEYGATWGTVTQGANNGKTITVNFPEGTKITKTAYLDFSVLALPIQQKDVTITFYFKENDGTEYHKSVLIKKNGSAATFAAAKKHIITNDALTGEIITYYLDVTPTLTFNYLGATKTYAVTSYKQVGSTGQKIPVQWEAYSYVVDGGSATSTKPSWLPAFTVRSTNPDANPKNFNVKVTPADRHNPGLDLLVDSTPKGSETSPYDLSLHNIKGGSISKTTANCYVVSAPGWYKFPVAYGNAYKNGNTNTDAYKHTLSSYNSHYLKNFKDSNDKNITTPDISGADGVQLVWQDAQDLVAADDIRLENGYIVFYVAKETIREGNAVIAAKKGTNTLWSWHIWVTPYVGTDVTVKGQKYMARNLGWCEGGTTTWTARKVVISFRQTEAASTAGTKKLTITQSGNTETVLGSGPHYQWGRKDPMIPPIGLSDATQYAANKIFYNQSGVASQNVDTQQGPRTLGYAIKMPATMIYLNRGVLPSSSSGAPYCDWTETTKYTDITEWESDSHYCNLWNYNINKNGTTNTGLVVTDYTNLAHGKTVYDPCPIGYTIPTPYELANMATYKTSNYMGSYTITNTNPGTWENGATMKGYTVGGNFWAANGMRMYVTTNQHVANVGKYGYWFSSAAYHSHYALALILYSPNNGEGFTPGFTIDGSYAKGSARSVRCVPE